MARLRVGGVGPQSVGAYVQEEALEIPPYLADLATAPGHCYSPEVVAECGQSAPGVVCRDCAMSELGERWDLFKARTNASIPKAKFYRDLDASQAMPDDYYRRMLARQRLRDRAESS